MEHQNNTQSDYTNLPQNPSASRGWIIIFGFFSFALNVIITLMVTMSKITDLSQFLPGTARLELTYIWLFGLVLLPIIGLLGSFLFLKLYFGLFKAFKRKKFAIGHIQMTAKQFNAKDMVGRCVLPVLLSVSMALMIMQFLSLIGEVNNTDDVGQVFSLTLGILPLAMLICIPMWLSEDFGLLMYKKGQYGEVIPEIQSIGTYYSYFVKGFAGLTTIFQFGFIIISSILQESNKLMLLLIILFPFGVLGNLLPIQIFMYKKDIQIRAWLLKKLRLPIVTLDLNLLHVEKPN